MRHRLSIWWHRRVVGHELGTQVPIATIEMPWPEYREFLPTYHLWALRCAEPDCLRVWVTVEVDDTEAELETWGDG